jgi:hypothetical protein|tara:strand:- start:12 stop:752 length:741 start_codon:yes stop_codon:yes gene_type:complete
MCTIGASINNELILFKNCDLTKKTVFYKPKIKKGKYKYLAMTRKGRNGCWAGINENGLGIVAADTYTKKEYKSNKKTTENIFKGYEKTISEYKNTKEALKFLKQYYKNKIKIIPDLFIIADKSNMAVFEFTPPNKFGIKIKKKGFILRTNQFKILKDGKDKKQDPESYIRFDNALRFIKKGSLNQIKNLCCDHKNGPSKFSVCRHGKKGEYKTGASVIFVVNKDIKAYYVINNSPCKTKYKEVKLC